MPHVDVVDEEGIPQATVHRVVRAAAGVTQAYVRCNTCGGRVTRTFAAGSKPGQGRPIGFLAAWGEGPCLGAGRHAEEARARAGARGEQAFGREVRRAARGRLREQPGYDDVVGWDDHPGEREPEAGEGSEPDVVV